ncbi:unnamed protein product [Phaedon cochleariae]|uniref:Major facilitator superfamily (MFS) profile domain-containing protein n=1 Tax=Phaedon cochleariae TaxID=80249 RepID=A0A9P0GVM2_PHACE|nr:unnamed protein product [Phaedon cochleariae]
MLPPENKDLIPECVKDPIKVYRKRWWILFIYSLYASANAFQWLEYSIITNSVMKYYDVSSLMVDWTSLIYMAAYPVTVIPVSYIIDVKGLRVAALCGGIGTAIAALIKIFAIGRDLFYLVLLGQAVGSTAQVFILSLPTKVAAVWFKPSEVSTACAIGVFGNQLGFALGFIIPPTLVKSDDDLNTIASNLKILCVGLVIYMIPLIVCLLFFFPKQPPSPPSYPQAEARKQLAPTFREFMENFKKVIMKKGFIFHMLGYGLNYGIFSVVATLLNQYVLQHFPNGEEDAGRMGSICIICGMFGVVLAGVVLDKTHKYKATCLCLFYMSILSLASFIVALWQQSMIFTYIVLSVFAFFNNSYITAGFEFAVEITFPHEESTATGILNAVSQAAGVVILLAAGKINEKFGSLWSLIFQLILMVLAAFLTHFVPNVMNRQNAIAKNNIKTNEYVVIAQKRFNE